MAWTYRPPKYLVFNAEMLNGHHFPITPIHVRVNSSQEAYNIHQQVDAAICVRHFANDHNNINDIPREMHVV